ncbi:MAG: hypothetical protein J6B48_08760 [Clostridia bacterium]|nr:hypothetical protein [Clostridia bacterium]
MKANKFRLKIRMLSLVLALLTVFYILPTSAFAEAALPRDSENQGF